MAQRWLLPTAVASLSLLALATPAAAARASAPAAGRAHCSAGARTLSPPGSHLYPETGNGGYTSVHTAVHLVYDATADMFLPGSHVVLTDRATQCLSSFSLDFERHSANTEAGPDMTVHAVTVNGRPAHFAFAQPTYPGDPHGPGDPNPAAHEASQNDPVGGPKHNPLPPACSPELRSGARPDALNGTQCPADKLVITPAAAIDEGAAFTVSVSWTGRPGVHNDGDGSTEGWFRSSDGGFVTTEPVGTEDWMPLNDYPAAKPTYDFYDTVTAGRTAICNGVLVSVRHNRPDAEFPGGSTTWHWHSRAPVASYLVEDSIGKYDLTERTADNGIRYYEAQDASIPAAQQQKNLAIMKQQEAITAYESQFSGAFPFTSDGVVIGTPPASFEEEMQTMITFAGGTIGLSVFYHENFHQWWGDNVTEAGYAMTFYKEGMATMAQDLLAARQAEDKAGGPSSRTGQAAFQATLVRAFDQTWAKRGAFWSVAPSNPAPYELFGNAGTYARPAAAYLALRQILGPTDFTQAMEHIQRHYRGGHITEPELEAAFHQWMPNRSGACQAQLTDFFHQWFDTAYSAGHRPTITGPGLSGPGFYNQTGGCSPGV